MYYFLQLYPEEDYLTGDQLMWEFNEEVIKNRYGQCCVLVCFFFLGGGGGGKGGFFYPFFFLLKNDARCSSEN